MMQCHSLEKEDILSFQIQVFKDSSWIMKDYLKLKVIQHTNSIILLLNKIRVHKKSKQLPHKVIPQSKSDKMKSSCRYLSSQTNQEQFLIIQWIILILIIRELLRLISINRLFNKKNQHYNNFNNNSRQIEIREEIDQRLCYKKRRKATKNRHHNLSKV